MFFDRISIYFLGGIFAALFVWLTPLGAQEQIKRKVGAGLNRYEDSLVKKGLNVNLHYHYDSFYKKLFGAVDIEHDLSANSKNTELSARSVSVETKTSRVGAFLLVGIGFAANTDVRVYLAVGPYYYQYGEEDTYEGISADISRLYPKKKSFTTNGLGYGWIGGLEMSLFANSAIFLELRNVTASGEVEHTSELASGSKEKESRAYNAGYMRWNIGYRYSF